MTVEELRWKLRDYDDDIEVQTFSQEIGTFAEPRLQVVERPTEEQKCQLAKDLGIDAHPGCEDCNTKSQWIVRL